MKNYVNLWELEQLKKFFCCSKGEQAFIWVSNHVQYREHIGHKLFPQSHHDFPHPAAERCVLRLSIPLDADTNFSKSTTTKL